MKYKDRMTRIMEYMPADSLALSLRDYYASKQTDFQKLYATYEIISSSTAKSVSELEDELSTLSSELYYDYQQVRTKVMSLPDGRMVKFDDLIDSIIEANNNLELTMEVNLDTSYLDNILTTDGSYTNLNFMDEVLSEIYITNSIIQDTFTQLSNFDENLDTQIDVSAISSVLGVKYDSMNPKVSEVLFNVLNVLSNSGTSIKLKIQALVELMTPTVQVGEGISFVTMDGAYTGVSPAAAWMASLDIDLSWAPAAIATAASAVVGSVVAVWNTAFKWIKKGAIKLAQMTVAPVDFKEDGGKRNLLAVPYQQGIIKLDSLLNTTDFYNVVPYFFDGNSGLLNMVDFYKGYHSNHSLSDQSAKYLIADYIQRKLSPNSFLDIDFGFAYIRLFLNKPHSLPTNAELGYIIHIGFTGQGRDFIAESPSLDFKMHSTTWDGQQRWYAAPDSTDQDFFGTILDMYDPNEVITSISNNQEAWLMMRNSVYLLYSMIHGMVAPISGDLQAFFRDIAEMKGMFYSSIQDYNSNIQQDFETHKIGQMLPVPTYLEIGANMVFQEDALHQQFGDWKFSDWSPMNNKTFIEKMGSTILEGTSWGIVRRAIIAIFNKMIATEGDRDLSVLPLWYKSYNESSILFYTKNRVHDLDAKWTICTDDDNKQKFKNFLTITVGVAAVLAAAYFGLKITKSLKQSHLKSASLFQNSMRALGAADPNGEGFDELAAETFRLGRAANRKAKLLNSLGIKSLVSTAALTSMPSSVQSLIPLPQFGELRSSINSISNSNSDSQDKLDKIISDIGL